LVARTPARLPRYSRYTRYARPLEPMAMGRSRSARGGKREPALAGAAESFLAVDAVVTEADRPATRATRLDDKVETRTTSVRVFGACRPRPHRFNEAVGDDLSHDCIPPRGVKG